MPSQVTLLLKVPKYIKNYLISLYGQEPVFFPKKSDYNAFLLRKLTRPPVNNRPDFFCNLAGSCKFESLSCDRYIRNNYLEIAVPYSEFKNIDANNYLGRDPRHILRREIERHFIYDFHNFIREQMREGIERRIATITFMGKHNILEDDLSFSAFYRDFNRMLQKRRLTSCKTVV